jgi:diguanylate cyclase (GGDEF)-like protein
MNIDNFQKYRQEFGTLQAEAILKRVSIIIRDSVTEIDRVGRTGGNEFAIVLPEKNKRKAQDLAEDIRKKIEFTFMEERDASKRLTISGGVSENPLDGITAEELVNKARELVELAKKQGKNRIIGLKEPPVCL